MTKIESPEGSLPPLVMNCPAEFALHDGPPIGHRLSLRVGFAGFWKVGVFVLCILRVTQPVAHGLERAVR